MSIKPDLVVQASPESLTNLLKSRKFQIPDHQRDYVWKEENIRQLLMDLIDHCKNSEVTENNRLVEKPKTYFLGSMVACKPQAGEELLEVIDGQQRLTTISCISAVLKEELEKYISTNNKNVIGFISQLNDLIRVFSRGEWVMKLSLYDKNINNFFKETLAKDNSEQRNEYWNNNEDAKILLKPRMNTPAIRIKKAIEIAQESLKKYTDESANESEKLDKLISFAGVFCECVIVLLIESKDYATVYNLFESLNYRGMPLTQADLVKNQIIKRCSNGDEKQNVSDDWADIKEAIAHHELLLPEFLHVSYLSRFEYIKREKLFNNIKDKLTRISAVDFSTYLKDDAISLKTLCSSGGPENWSLDTRQVVKDLVDVLDLNLAFIGLLAAERHLRNDQSKAAKVVNLIVNFCFRYMKVQGGDVSTLATSLNHVSDLIQGSKSPDEIGDYLKKISPDSIFIEKFKSFSDRTAKVGYYTVYKIEKLKLHGTIPLQHSDIQHLEHIMPKNPSVRHWPAAAALKKEERENYRNLIWRIGNLIPLPREINSSIKNKGILEKISNSSGKDYMHNSLQSPKEIRNFLEGDCWNEKSIEKRQNELAEKFAIKAWPL